jgi:hypothetical protein
MLRTYMAGLSAYHTKRFNGDRKLQNGCWSWKTWPDLTWPDLYQSSCPDSQHGSLTDTQPTWPAQEILSPTAVRCGLGSSVGIATDYGLDGPGIKSRWGVRFFTHVQTSPGAHPASCTVGTGSFLGVKQSGRGADHPPPSSAKVKKG